uniref:Uncharacterized protein n=1 Tax=Ananas comosus var. bracteatus TaxID=296719 RepID=A0A6V7PYM6_ANACO|nr:unnamed protein product [Ananas comosus var. bracteatus]
MILKSTGGTDTEWSREVKGNMYDMVVEGFQLLSRWTGKIWEQSDVPCCSPTRNRAKVPPGPFEPLGMVRTTQLSRVSQLWEFGDRLKGLIWQAFGAFPRVCRVIRPKYSHNQPSRV